jgi:predicted DNA-binding protein
MPRRKLITTIYLTEEQKEKLKQLSLKTKIPVSEYIREGIDMVLEKNKDKLPGQLTIDEYLKKGNKA